MSPAIPDTLSDITPRWMTDVLRADGLLEADAKVVSLHPTRIGEGVGIMGELRVAELTYERSQADAPTSVVVKTPSPFEANREQGINLGMYEAEVRFYNELAPQIPTGIPAVHLATIVAGTAEFVVVMEDLSHLELVDQAAGMTPDQAAAATRVLADVHAAFWGRVDTPELDWVPAPLGARVEMVSQMLPQLLPIYLDRFADVLPAGGVDHIEWFAADSLAAYQALNASTAATLVHSDYRVENLLFGDPAADEVVVIDWQGLGRAPGTLDLAYLLSGSMQIEDRRAHERDLVRTYVERLASHGTEVDHDDVWHNYRIAQTTGGLAVSMVGGATLDLANERGKELLDVMSVRHVTAALDHDAAALVRDA